MDFLQKNREIHSDVEMKLMSQINQFRKTIDHIDFVSEFCNSYLRKCSVIHMCRLIKVVLGCTDYLKSVNFHPDNPSKILFSAPQLDLRDYVQRSFGSFDIPSSKETQSPSDSLSVAVSTNKNLTMSEFVNDEISEVFRNMDLKHGVCHMDNFSSQHHPLSLADNHMDHIRAKGLMAPENGIQQCIVSHRPAPLNLTANVSAWGDGPIGTFDSVSSAFNSSSSPIHQIFMNQGLSATHDGLRSPSSIGAGIDMDANSVLSRSKLPINYNASLYEYSRVRSARCSNMTLLTKWGSLGCELGRLNSPHGFCLGFDEEIVVADTYNHRIQVQIIIT